MVRALWGRRHDLLLFCGLVGMVATVQVSFDAATRVTLLDCPKEMLSIRPHLAPLVLKCAVCK